MRLTKATLARPKSLSRDPRAARRPRRTSPARDPGATLDDLREAVTTLEETARIARRVLGGAHPTAVGIEHRLREARAALRARETPPTDAREARDLGEVEGA